MPTVNKGWGTTGGCRSMLRNVCEHIWFPCRTSLRYVTTAVITREKREEQKSDFVCCNCRSNKKRHKCLYEQWLRVWGDLVLSRWWNRADEGAPRTTSNQHRHKTEDMPTRTSTTLTNTYLFSHSLVNCECKCILFCNSLNHTNTDIHVQKLKKRKRIDKLNRYSHQKPLQVSLVRARSLASSPHSEHFLD